MQDATSQPDVVICECFCRDGLQHETLVLPADVKIDLLDRFSALGFQRIEATSYSNPAVVPQFADAGEVLAGIARRPGVHYKATCPNPRAVERALADLRAGRGATEISMLVSASESHSQRNLKRPRADQWENVRQMAALAAGSFRLIGTISVAFGCPFEGEVDARRVIDDAIRFREYGVEYITLGDTTGMATPHTVRGLFRALQQELPDATLIAHFHDSRGTALVNCVAALDAGVRYFDAAIGGVGGHPAKVKYGGGYTGNACTEDLVDLFEAMGVRTGIDLPGLLDTGRHCETVLDRKLAAHVTHTGANPLRPR
ncbi:hydroxymethylglutaryl-CoA lyase [Bordetella genomosp. 10]|uniref:Hydroxymethylglutaryl-CoA lyase n=1 Tax=Bordetella genomosp. 10 TaxID=1416804 RepID=A0A261S171_9BORD|nr:hydroxymethylglutaryl-CoA lyase [Bordetella genomosp. 10]OZI30702.1 hydroxymethylglutaryl-CoA lyase [Bordetella genomosp. 10]